MNEAAAIVIAGGTVFLALMVGFAVLGHLWSQEVAR